MINKKYFKTTNRFKQDLQAGLISNTDLVFIEESGLIYTHGHYFGGGGNDGINEELLESRDYVSWGQLNQFLINNNYLNQAKADGRYALIGTSGPYNLDLSSYLTKVDAEDTYLKKINYTPIGDIDSITNLIYERVILRLPGTGGGSGEDDSHYYLTTSVQSGYNEVSSALGYPFTQITYGLYYGDGIVGTRNTPDSLAYNINGSGSWSTIAVSSSSTLKINLPETPGTYTIQIRASKDGQYYYSSVMSVVVTDGGEINNPDPTYTLSGSIVSGYSSFTYNNGNTFVSRFTYQFKEDGALTAPDTLSYKVGSLAAVSVSSPASSGTVTGVVIPGSTGTYSIVVTATKGGTSKSVTIGSVTVNAAPTYTLTCSLTTSQKTLTYNNGNNLTSGFTYSFKQGSTTVSPDTITYSVDGGTQVSASTSSTSVTGVSIPGTVGSHTILVTATKGSTTKTYTLTVTVSRSYTFTCTLLTENQLSYTGEHGVASFNYQFKEGSNVVSKIDTLEYLVDNGTLVRLTDCDGSGIIQNVQIPAVLGSHTITVDATKDGTTKRATITLSMVPITFVGFSTAEAPADLNTNGFGEAAFSNIVDTELELENEVTGQYLWIKTPSSNTVKKIATDESYVFTVSFEKYEGVGGFNYYRSTLPILKGSLTIYMK